MSFDADIPKHVPPVREIPHYHGDAARALFVIEAILLVIAPSMGAILSVSTTGALIGAVILVIAAGITNPAQAWIQYVDEALALLGAVVFGMRAVNTYPVAGTSLDTSFIFALALALISLVALYLTTRTIRGFIMRDY